MLPNQTVLFRELLLLAPNSFEGVAEPKLEALSGYPFKTILKIDPSHKLKSRSTIFG
jgi:hypothetical protein